MSTENNSNQQGQGGSGSAENRGEKREAQVSGSFGVDADEKSNIAEQTGLKPDDIADLQDLGAASGRGDAAGGSGDDMTSTSTNEGTDRF